jgi:hypothetical protein
MADKKPIRAVFNDSNVATGLAEFQSGDTVGLTHGGLGVSLSIGSAGQVLKVNSGASALEFGNVEAVVNIDNATDLTSATLATTDLLLASDGGTEGRVTLAQLDTLFSGTSKTLTNKTLTTPTITTPIINAGAQLKNGSTSAGFLEFFEDSDNGSNKVTLIGPASTADITLTLPAAAGTIVASGDTGTVTNAMLAGSIAASKLAGSIGNSKLSNSSITVSDGSSTSDISLGGTLTLAATANETTVSESSGTVTIGIVDNPTIGGNLTVTGNLTVNGSTTTLSTTNSVIEDKLIELSTGTTGTPSGDIGLVGERGSSANVFIGFDESADEFVVGTGTFTGASTGDLTITKGTFSSAGNKIYRAGTTNAVSLVASSSLAGNVTLTLPVNDGDANQLLATDGSGNLSFISATSASGAGLSNVSDDSSPSLGGDLDTNNSDIVTASNRNLNLLPNGTGVVIMDGNGSSGGVSVSDGLIDIRTGTGNVAKVKFYCESSNAHAQTLQAAPHSEGSSAVLVLPTASGTLVGTGDTGSVSNTMLAGSIANSKLATISTADKVSLSALDIDGGTDIGANLADADLIIVDDGAGGTERKAAMSRVKTYIEGGISGDITISSGTAAIGSGVIVNADINSSAAIADSKLATISTAGKVELGALEIDGASEMGAALADADLLIVDDGAGGTEKSMLASRIPTYVFSKVSGDATVASNGALTIASDAVEQSMIADDAVGADQLAASAVVTASIVDDNVTQAKIADDAVGADQLASNAVVNASVSSSAAIEFSKMENLTASRVLVSDGSGDVSASSVTSTSLGFVDATSSIQTQLDTKASVGFAIAQAVALG